MRKMRTAANASGTHTGDRTQSQDHVMTWPNFKPTNSYQEQAAGTHATTPCF